MDNMLPNLPGGAVRHGSSHRLASLRFLGTGFCCAMVLLLVTGCPPVMVDPPDDGDPGGNGQRTVGEPNDTFSQALELVLDDAGSGRLSGSIPIVDDVDVYRLGEFLAGDQIIIDVNTMNSGLDAMLALFDGGGRLIYENDDRNLSLNQLDPFINHVIRQDTMVLYIAIAPSPLNLTTGTYDAAITVSRGGATPEARPQTVVLDVDGGTVTIGGRDYVAGPFDTGDISASYEGLTEIVLDQIVATVLDNYAGLQFDVLVTGRDAIPDGCEASTVLLGGSSSTAYGLAEQIDWYNQDTCDNAVVFTNMFQPFRFGRTLTARELGTAIGNVVAHEVGHILGLNHVANVYDVMDTTGTANSFLLDQTFTSSPLDDTIFPIGLQDGLMLLLLTLGESP